METTQAIFPQCRETFKHYSVFETSERTQKLVFAQDVMSAAQKLCEQPVYEFSTNGMDYFRCQVTEKSFWLKELPTPE